MGGSRRRRIFAICLAGFALAASVGAAVAYATWTKPAPIGVGDGVLKVAVDADGNALVAWAGFGLQARARAADGTLGPMQTITPSLIDVGPSNIDTDASGNGYFVWGQGDAPY